MGSYWLEEPRSQLPVRPLRGRVDVAVVGGGVTGCACAHVLAGAGLRVRLHEAGEIAAGPAGETAGLRSAEARSHTTLPASSWAASRLERTGSSPSATSLGWPSWQATPSAGREAFALPQTARSEPCPTPGQVVVTEPLARRLFPSPHYARYGYDYCQQTPDDRLVAGGRRDAALDEEQTAEEGTTEVIQAHLECFVAELTGDSAQITHRWSGIFGVIEDRLPLVGRVPGREGLWVACGYSGHGNVLGLTCGELVGHAILGRPDPELELFEPARLLRS